MSLSSTHYSTTDTKSTPTQNQRDVWSWGCSRLVNTEGKKAVTQVCRNKKVLDVTFGLIVLLCV